MLAVDEENGAARRSYEKAGWIETGIREQGRIGWVRYMNRVLDVSCQT
jgi:RimJ/RimL family protein N-acetyltransferase